MFIRYIKEEDSKEIFTWRNDILSRNMSRESRQISLAEHEKWFKNCLNKSDLDCYVGINHGSNSSINIIYSGTMSAAVEAGIEGIPAIGFSLLDCTWDADFEQINTFVKRIALSALSNGIPKGVVLNVNLPKLAKKEIKGIRICRQAMAYWVEEFDKREDPTGEEYYWLTGKFINEDNGEDTDEWALENGYVSVVPVHFDMTAHHSIQKLNTWDF